MSLMRVSTLITVLYLLSGCETYQALTYSNDHASYEIKGEKFYLATISPKSPTRITTTVNDPHASDIWSTIDDGIREKCSTHAPELGEQPAFALPAAAITFAVGALIDVGVSTIGTLAEKKQQQFTRTYSSKINIGNFSLNNSDDDTTCIMLLRTYERNDEQITAMIMILKFESVGDAYTLKPIYLVQYYPAARTRV